MTQILMLDGTFSEPPQRSTSSSYSSFQQISEGFVKAEMKKRVTYKPSVQIRTTCQVISATCTCPAGGTPAFCKHVFALLLAINDYITKKTV
ncbi:hypothetical protein TNCV_1455831 [Trichonephila clavipes]|nr:hypothetical protein TNCV_1455831 [Trichonephila clavipes]